MTAPRRALPPAPVSRTARLLGWLRTSWHPAALASAGCLVVAGLWPVPQVPPSAPSFVAPAVAEPASGPTAGQTVAHLAGPVLTSAAPVATGAVPTSTGGEEAGTPPPTRAPTPVGPRLVLADLAISAPLREVGVVGPELEIPEDPLEVGIWRDGAKPGDPAGTVLVTGHVSWAGERGALWHLAGAEPGHGIELVSPDGDTSRWRVAAVERLRRDADHPELFTTSGPHRLVVVTCGGPVVDGHYRDLVAVVAFPQ